MKFPLASALCLLSFATLAQSPVVVTVDIQSPGQLIPRDFVGVSIFTGTQVKDHRSVPGNLFSGTNFQLITLFKNTGLHHLRLGATGSSDSGSKNLDHADIDSLFAFAKATDIKVIYSLHGADAAAAAQYVWTNYRANLDCFAFDNEPDGRIDKPTANGSNYFADWRYIAKSVTDAVPGAKFAGPDAAGRTLVPKFIKQEQDTGCLALITQHIYVGGNPIKRHIDLPHAIDNMLSPEWVNDNYPALYKGRLRAVIKAGLRAFDEANHGSTEPVAIADTNKLNLTAYAIGDAANLYVTIINKEHGAGARAARVTIMAKNFGATGATAIFLTAPDKNLQATNGVTLGGATISNDAPWHGKWTALKPDANGQCTVSVAASSAAVVKLLAHD